MQEIKLLSKEPLFRTKIIAAKNYYLYIGPKKYESGNKNTLQYL